MDVTRSHDGSQPIPKRDAVSSEAIQHLPNVGRRGRMSIREARDILTREGRTRLRHAWLPKLVMSLLPTISAASASECVVRSAALRAHLVELYTSEGCSSCPPAEAWLGTLRAGETLVPLAFHVDYWDSLGWPDPYAAPRHTARQRELAARSRSPVVYTPEVALDGREWRGWRSRILPDIEQPAAVELEMHLELGARLRVRLTTHADRPDPGWRAYLALTESGIARTIRAGENAGRQLRHDHVVREFAGPLELDAASIEWVLPRDLVAARSAVAGFVQHPGTGAVLQVVRADLRTCGEASE